MQYFFIFLLIFVLAGTELVWYALKSFIPMIPAVILGNLLYKYIGIQSKVLRIIVWVAIALSIHIWIYQYTLLGYVAFISFAVVYSMFF